MKKWTFLQALILIVLIASLSVFALLMHSWTTARTVKTVNFPGDGTYSGEFKGKQFDGKGTFKSENGVVYSGQWKDGEMEGYGTMTYVNGVKYEGNFECGQYNGKGKLTKADGTVIEGIWENGELKEEIKP